VTVDHLSCILVQLLQVMTAYHRDYDRHLQADYLKTEISYGPYARIEYRIHVGPLPAILPGIGGVVGVQRGHDAGLSARTVGRWSAACDRG